MNTLYFPVWPIYVYTLNTCATFFLLLFFEVGYFVLNKSTRFCHLLACLLYYFLLLDILLAPVVLSRFYHTVILIINIKAFRICNKSDHSRFKMFQTPILSWHTHQHTKCMIFMVSFMLRSCQLNLYTFYCRHNFFFFNLCFDNAKFEKWKEREKKFE